MSLCLVPSFSECRLYIYFLVTPFLYIIHPFSFWFSYFCFSFHLPENHLLYQSAIFHSTDVLLPLFLLQSPSLVRTVIPNHSPIHARMYQYIIIYNGKWCIIITYTRYMLIELPKAGMSHGQSRLKGGPLPKDFIYRLCSAFFGPVRRKSFVYDAISGAYVTPHTSLKAPRIIHVRNACSAL